MEVAVYIHPLPNLKGLGLSLGPAMEPRAYPYVTSTMRDIFGHNMHQKMMSLPQSYYSYSPSRCLH